MQKVFGVWQGGEEVAITLSTGTEIRIDEQGLPKSTDLLLAGLISCSCGVLNTVLEKMRVSIESLHIETITERATERPKIFTRLDLIYKIGVKEGLEPKIVNAVKLTEKYCTVYNILKPGTNIKVKCLINNVEYEID